MKEQPWVSVQPRKLRQNLDGLLNQLKNFPARLRQYASYEYVLRLLKGYMKINMLVIELKSEALKDRHWKQLMKKLHVNWAVSELTLGQIWDVDLQKNETIVKDVLLVAQGEMALEAFLKQIREVWNTYELDLVNYHYKCHLIRGWDDLFNKVKEHINSVSAMKLSPYFKAMGRIFVGLCQVGAWGCFDEFNRLEERMLSAVSQQVQCIQEALREHCNPNYDK
ncbi:cytoplasmic dynein 1 heavy chain 1-like, partial [Terrapene carolina triunguis]|uniref:cytoplasmic dynein 1 heavy chain 1-like n=1 Tax=Terrapene triunguis TaxID=2587831 RepID=UPI001156B85C